MQTAQDLKGYRRHIQNALDNGFQRQAMDKFAVAYRTSRANAFAGMDVAGLIAQIAAIKDKAAASMDGLLDQFTHRARAAGVHVHVAATADEANRIIAAIARDNGVKTIVKAKSMTAEETLLNHHLQAAGFGVTETDLGEWIIQLRGEGPSHMVMPAIHLSRFQVADLFTKVTGAVQQTEIERLVKVARRELRQKFAEADMGISGANYAIAATGTIGITTNEGNARLVTTLPRVHVALIGLEKLLPGLHEALVINQGLPRNATGQQITSYVTWITGPNACGAAADGRKQMHIVFLDNGRRALAADPVFAQVLRCVRCGACANVCPVYRMVGGHQYGHIYIGAIGLILTYFFHGRDKARNLVQNCLNCGACKAVCAAGIDLPRLIKAVMAKVQDDEGQPLTATLLAKVMRDRRIFHGLLKTARATQKPLAGDTPYLRHLPMALLKAHEFRAIPALADTPFRGRWPAVRPRVERPRLRIALFAGCLQDFVYPEHLEAALRLLARDKVEAAFPLDQTCCGLPLEMTPEHRRLQGRGLGPCGHLMRLLRLPSEKRLSAADGRDGPGRGGGRLCGQGGPLQCLCPGPHRPKAHRGGRRRPDRHLPRPLPPVPRPGRAPRPQAGAGGGRFCLSSGHGRRDLLRVRRHLFGQVSRGLGPDPGHQAGRCRGHRGQGPGHRMSGLRAATARGGQATGAGSGGGAPGRGAGALKQPPSTRLAVSSQGKRRCRSIPGPTAPEPALPVRPRGLPGPRLAWPGPGRWPHRRWNPG